ncbi:DUF3990 domain-containing protein [Halalkalibacter okhensis]|uniref:DUF3990 domain-containing protein n=1 Tax=Halalkalibacter okhensis TaxID=333138 RepID=A0A0B0IIC2_9BACI|nr:DUF3990 domain-containing protein [Halalkalibacter okhensis]KHF40637.1 hypothetical protein LQ50_07450 [Halalkalibacter okhensis]
MEDVFPATARVFHGTNLFAAKIILKHGIWLDIQRRLTDFGPGFYVTCNREQAKNWALVRAEHPQVYRGLIDRLNMNISNYFNHPDTKKAAYLFYDIDINKLKDLNGKYFPLPQHSKWPLSHKKWRKFVNDCRSGKAHKYDFVYGPVGKKHKTNSHQILLSRAKDQLSLNSEKAIHCLSNPRIIPVNVARGRVHSFWQPYVISEQVMQRKLKKNITMELLKLGDMSKKEAQNQVEKSWIFSKAQFNQLLLNEPPTFWAYSILKGNDTLWYQEYESHVYGKQSGRGS